MSLRWYLKILSAFILVILIVVLPSTFYLGSNLKNFLMSQKEQELRLELQLAGQMVSDYFNAGPGDTAKMQKLALQVAADLQKRVTIISGEGRVLGDSGLTSEAVDKMEDHSNRAEILAAREKGFGQSIRFSTTLQANTLYGAIPIRKNDQLAGYVRLALPLSQVETLVSALRRNLALAGVLTGILAILLSLFLTWSINRPLREITGMVKKMADGDLKQPFHLLPKTEFGDLTLSLERMAKELREKMELLDTETSQLTTLLSTMREGVLITDDKGRIILMNPFLQELLGKKVIWKKRTVQEIFMNGDLQDAVESVLRDEPYKGLQVVYGRTPQMHFDVQVAALFPEQGSHRAVALFHDTTKLQYLLKVRQDFVANASHELRTPLTSISGYVETLLSLAPPDPPEFRRFLSIIQKNVNQMNFLVSDLLDLAKLDIREKPEKSMIPVPVKDVLETAEQMIREHVKKKGIDFSKEWDNLPEGITAFWDKDRIVQALFNVLDNAVKYTPEGGQIRLIAKIVRSSEFGVKVKKELTSEQITQHSELDRDFIEISVADTGIGIPKELLSRIFERFYRVDKARSRDLGGTGLGLAIVKHIIETHGGSVQVDSVVGKGSIFTLFLPLGKGLSVKAASD